MSAMQGKPPDPLQGGFPADEAVLAAELEQTQGLIGEAEAVLAPRTPAAADPDLPKAEQLRAEQAMVEMVLAQGLGGRREEYLLVELMKYALPVLKSMLRDGRIFAKCSKLNRPVSDEVPSFLDWTEQDREEIARDMISDGLPVFRKSVFENRKWTPDRGASLKTYFVNACVLTFPQIYRKWNDDRRRLVPLDEEHANVPSPRDGRDPAVGVATRDRIRRAVDGLPTEQISALTDYSMGYTVGEAAERNGLTRKQLEGKMSRLREKHGDTTKSSPGSGEEGGSDNG